MTLFIVTARCVVSLPRNRIRARDPFNQISEIENGRLVVTLVCLGKLLDDFEQSVLKFDAS